MQTDKLISQVISNVCLQKAIVEMEEETSALNLIVPNWKNVLQESPVYQKHIGQKVRYSKGQQTNVVFLRNIIGMENHYNVILVGYWNFYNPDKKKKLEKDQDKNVLPKNVSISLKSRQCEPLLEIGKSMAENPHQKFFDNCKFYMNGCDPISCYLCSRYKCKMDPETRAQNDWCVTRVKIYDGEKIKPEYKVPVVKAFENCDFLGIVHLSISSRYTFGEDNFKVGGTINQMILFKSANLNVKLDLDLDMDYPTNLTVEEPKREEEEEDATEENANKKIKLITNENE